MTTTLSTSCPAESTTVTAACGLLMVASHFPPWNAAGVFRSLRFARYLPELDWQVHVLTLDPRYYEAQTPVDASLLSKIPEEVSIHRTAAVYPMRWIGGLKSAAKGLVRRGGASKQPGGEDRPIVDASLTNETSGEATASWYQRCKDAVTLPLMTPDHFVGWLPFATRQGKRLIRQHNLGIIYSSGPPWTNHLIGARLKRATGLAWVADFRDPWVNADFKLWRMGNSWVGRKHQSLERRVLELADRVIVNTQGSYDDLVSRYGDRLAEKLTVISNGFDPQDFVGMAESGPHPGGQLVLAHAGSLYGRRNVDSLIQAVSNLHNRGCLSPGELEVRLIGAQRTGRDHETRLIHALGVAAYFKLTDMVPHAECLRLLAEADVLLLVQVGAPISLPGKVFEYIALGKQMLVMGSPGVTSRFAQQENLGTCVAPDSVAEIEAAVLALVERRRSGDRFPSLPAQVQQQFDGRRLTARLDRVLRDALTTAATNRSLGYPADRK